jgi:cytoskeletal protein CcmA (bactofilin family)
MRAARKIQGAPESMLQPSDSQKSQSSSNQSFAPPRAVAVPVEQATIGRSLVVKGEISGSESLYIDGKVEGTINLTDSRVTIGRNGSVAASISAREVVILGKVHGNIQVTDRLDIRSEGSLTGDVITQRISVEDGAILKGSVQVRAVEHKNAQGQAKPASAEPAKQNVAEQPKAAAAVAGV